MSEKMRNVVFIAGIVLVFGGLVGFIFRDEYKKKEYIRQHCSRSDITSVDYIPGAWGSSPKTVLHLDSGGTVVLNGGHYSIAGREEN